MTLSNAIALIKLPYPYYYTTSTPAISESGKGSGSLRNYVNKRVVKRWRRYERVLHEAKKVIKLREASGV